MEIVGYSDVKTGNCRECAHESGRVSGVTEREGEVQNIAEAKDL